MSECDACRDTKRCADCLGGGTIEVVLETGVAAVPEIADFMRFPCPTCRATGACDACTDIPRRTPAPSPYLQIIHVSELASN